MEAGGLTVQRAGGLCYPKKKEEPRGGSSIRGIGDRVEKLLDSDRGQRAGRLASAGDLFLQAAFGENAAGVAAPEPDLRQEIPVTVAVKDQLRIGLRALHFRVGHEHHALLAVCVPELRQPVGMGRQGVVSGRQYAVRNPEGEWNGGGCDLSIYLSVQ